MTIQSVALTQEGTSLSATGTDGERVKRNYTAHYRVITDNATTSSKAIEKHFKNTPTLPWFGRSWKWTGTNTENDSDSDAICKKLEVSHQPGSEGIFKVEATFEPNDGKSPQEKPDNGDGSNTDDPLEWREQVTVNYTQISVPVMYAVFRGWTTGDFANDPKRGTNKIRIGRTYPPMASNMVPYDPLPEMEIDIKVIRFIRNVPTFDSNLYDPWIGTVNEDEVNIVKQQLGFQVKFSPLTGRMKNINASSDFQNGVSFFRREVEVWVNPLGWRGKLLDEGDCAILEPDDVGYVAGGGLGTKPYQSEQKHLRDADGYPTMAHKPLDGYGHLLRTDAGEAHVWGNWSYYREVAWQPIAAQI